LIYLVAKLPAFGGCRHSTPNPSSITGPATRAHDLRVTGDAIRTIAFP
jgi:hypothetical protein